MANLLSTATSVANAVTAVNNIDVSGSSLTNAGVNAALSAATAITAGQNPLSAAAGAALGSIPGASSIASAANSVLGLAGSPLAGAIGGLSGTKPGALHTEYATGSADWAKPYGAGTDIIFYLERADGGGGGGGGDLGEAAAAAGFGDSAGLTGLNEGLAAAAGSVSEAVVPADIVAGAGLPDGITSAVNQVASAASMAGSLGSAFNAVPSLAGPLTGITEGLSTATSIATSAAAAINNPTLANVTAAVGATASLGGLSNTVSNSFAASEVFFNETLANSFNTAEDIVDGVTSLAAAPVSEFSTSMATMTRAVTSTEDFIAGINDGVFGYTPTGAKAEMDRSNPQGKPRKKS